MEVLTRVALIHFCHQLIEVRVMIFENLRVSFVADLWMVILLFLAARPRHFKRSQNYVNVLGNIGETPSWSLRCRRILRRQLKVMAVLI